MEMNLLQEKFLKKPYRVHGLLFLIFIAAGIIYDSPRGVLEGLGQIFSGTDVLVSDYIYIGGFGAALVNVGLVGLLSILALVLAKHEPGGLAMGTHGLAIGFAFFGKNPLNMMPIIIGGFLYAWVAKKPPSQCVLRAVLATCLAPAVTQVAYATDLPLPASVAIGMAVGILIGFLINPLAIHKEMAHLGYNLYNVGFAAGIIGMGIFAVYRLVGAYFYTADSWSSGYDPHLMILLLFVSGYFIICGAIAKGSPVTLRLFYEPHKTDNDYFTEHRERVYIHMGVLGLACFLFMLAVRGEYNGPVIGAILSVIGFGAFGKALLSAAPVVAGAMLAALASSLLMCDVSINDPNFLVAAIFSTCLSPLCRKFGFLWGMAAGFLHLALAVNIGGFHGGLNLYNNGFAGGLAAMILLPVILFVRRDKAV